MSALQLDGSADYGLDAAAEARALRQQAAERLAAHRQRRTRMAHAATTLPGLEPEGLQRNVVHADGEPVQKPAGRRKVAAAVAERYAQSPSYRAFLAQEAERAIRQAEAAAAVAARSAEAVVAVQQELLAELELWVAPQEFSAGTAETFAAPAVTAALPEASSGLAARDQPARELTSAGVTVRLYEDLGRTAFPLGASATRQQQPARIATGPGSSFSPRASHHHAGLDEEAHAEQQALEEEIEFRKAPMFDDFRAPGVPLEPIAANLIEFPRQLVAPRKVRPRLAEGPLLEEPQSRSGQLRIFEVEAGQVATEPAPAPAAPEWNSIWLEAQTSVEVPAVVPDGSAAILPSLLPPQTAPVSTRLMAAAVDLSLVALAAILFAGVSTYVAGEVPTGSVAGLSAAVLLAGFYLAYQLLFFSFSGDTPGMRYARIGLCTFTDENPSRRAMRRRVWSSVVAATPLGLGLLWVMLDDDRLGWHDRMSRMYQRSY